MSPGARGMRGPHYREVIRRFCGIIESAVWVTFTSWPATVRVPARAGPALAGTLKVTALVPDPEPAFVMVIHGSMVVADHEHCVPVVTLSVRIVLAGSMTNAVGVTVYTQLLACWVTVIVWPATISVPVRTLAVGFVVI